LNKDFGFVDALGQLGCACRWQKFRTRVLGGTKGSKSEEVDEPVV